MSLLFHIVLRLTRAEFAVANLIFISFSLCPSIVNVVPRYLNLSTVSVVSPLIVITFAWLFENSFTMILLFTDSLPYRMPLSSYIICL